MRADEVTRLAIRPASEVEWEELLLRLEIVPRVVRNTLETVSGSGPELDVLREAVRTESRVGRWLEAVALGRGAPAPDPGEEEGEGSAEWLAHRFAALRARTFAMVQRRGLEVWEWQGEIEPGRSASVHQVLLWLASHDASLLAGLRTALKGADAPC